MTLLSAVTTDLENNGIDLLIYQHIRLIILKNSNSAKPSKHQISMLIQTFTYSFDFLYATFNYHTKFGN